MTSHVDLTRSPAHEDAGVLALDPTDREAIRSLGLELTADPDARIDTPEWIALARSLSCRLPARVRESLRRFRRDPGSAGALLVRGLPVDDVLPATPSDPGSVERLPSASAAAQVLVSLQLGEVTSFRPEKSGALVQNVVPVPGQEDFQGNAGSTALKMHVENAFHDHRPDYVTLLCLRNDHDDRAGLRTASIRLALPLLPTSVRAVLFEPRFVTNPPPSFGATTSPATPTPILTGHPDDPDIRVDFHATDPLDVTAADALTELSHALDATSTTHVLRTGDLALVDNRITLHGRTAFRPRYDGNDRWLRRTFVHLDLRRSRPTRPADGHVLN
ncbi:TauD/TfdA family dioxygenase [Actinosynnema sp. NPDC020468]|uniref:TauD/TfdA family dioxygenase n=1 Tax=Actinosynnema sp. NPDC020468 TaxID=3154488 RepID=UPI0034019F8E